MDSDTYEANDDLPDDIGSDEVIPSNGLTKEENVELKKMRVDFNKLYAVVMEAHETVVFRWETDPVMGRTLVHRMTTGSLCNAYMNDRIKVGMKNETPVFRNKARYWLEHKQRRQYLNGVFFDPSGRQLPGRWNLWKGYRVTPAPGDWSLMYAHIRDVICCGNEQHLEYLLNLIADMLQNPAKQGEVAVVMQGVEGCGKGTLGKALRWMIGQHAMSISQPKHLVGNFNQHLRDCIFLFADEAFFAGDKQHVGTLKSLITEDTIVIERKGVDAAEAKNYLHIMMASNDDWVVPASVDARRFFVLKVSDCRVNDYDYFAEIWKQMSAGGYSAMMHDLLARDLSGFNVRKVPRTDALNEQKLLSLDTEKAWWLECLHNGYVFRSKLGLEDDFRQWMPEISTDLAYESYRVFAKGKGERRPKSKDQLGKFLIDMGAKKVRGRSETVLGESKRDYHSSPIKSKAGERTYRYSLGDLKAAQSAFCDAFKLTIDWDDAEFQPTLSVVTPPVKVSPWRQALMDAHLH